MADPSKDELPEEQDSAELLSHAHQILEEIGSLKGQAEAYAKQAEVFRKNADSEALLAFNAKQACEGHATAIAGVKGTVEATQTRSPRTSNVRTRLSRPSIPPKLPLTRIQKLSKVGARRRIRPRPLSNKRQPRLRRLRRRARPASGKLRRRRSLSTLRVRQQPRQDSCLSGRVRCGFSTGEGARLGLGRGGVSDRRVCKPRHHESNRRGDSGFVGGR